MKTNPFRFMVVQAMLLTPFLVFAQKTVGELIVDFRNIAFNAINFLLVLATLVFLWGVIKYISAGGDAAKVKEARSYILWGLIGLAIMGSVWAIVRFLERTVGTENQPRAIPQDIYQQR
jgi:hypothetical protein